VTIAIGTDGKSAEDRAHVLELMLSMRDEIVKAAPVFDDGFAKLSRKHDIVVSGPTTPNDSVKIGSGSNPPRLAITIDAWIAGRLPVDPLERALAIVDHGIALSREAPVGPDDQASELALLVSHEMLSIGASIAVRRPMAKGGSAMLEITSMNTNGSFTIKPARTGDGPFEPVFARLDLIAARATPRLTPAVECHWQALPGGGRTLTVRPSRASAMWRPDRLDAVAALRMHAAWTDVMAP
jgi:hypothetical protein